jgi:ABC-type transporter Mla subunit MlaD
MNGIRFILHPSSFILEEPLMLITCFILVICLIIGFAILTAFTSDLTAKVQAHEEGQSQAENLACTVGALANQVEAIEAILGGIAEREEHLCERVRVLAEVIDSLEATLGQIAGWQNSVDRSLESFGVSDREIRERVDTIVAQVSRTETQVHQVRSGLRQAGEIEPC